MWLLSQRTLSVNLLSLNIESKMKFIYLKEHLLEYFQKNDFTFFCDDVNLITGNEKFNKAVYMNNKSLESDLRFEDSHYPEYLFLISNVNKPTSLTNRANDLIKEVSNVEYNPYLFLLKIRQLFQVILYKDFGSKNWMDNWIMDRCYVIKIEDELLYYTVYDFPDLLEKLPDWILVKHTKVKNGDIIGYKMIIKFNV